MVPVLETRWDIIRIRMWCSIIMDMVQGMLNLEEGKPGQEDLDILQQREHGIVRNMGQCQIKFSSCGRNWKALDSALNELKKRRKSSK